MKKIRAAIVILLMIATVAFVACSRSDSGSAAGSGAPVKLTVELFDRGTDGGRTQVDNNAWTDWIKEKVLKDLNIELTFFVVPRFQEDVTIPNLMAAGSAPDLCYTYNNSALSSFREQGGLLDLTPYIERLLPDMKKLLGADPAFSGKDFIYRNQQPDGKMYHIPSYRVAIAQRNIFIRKDWLDKLGLPVPTTTQQFHDALAAFRDRDPGGVGRNNVIPLMQDYDVRWGFASFINPFITPNLNDKERYINNIVSERNVAFPGYKEGVRMVNQWFNEGLIFRDFPLLKSNDDFYNILKSGVAGAFSGNWDLPYRTDYKIIEDLRRNVPDAEFVPVDCIQSSDGITRKDMYDKVGLQIFVPTSSKNPEAALRYLNWLCIPENYHYLQVGQEGVNHRLVNGVPEITVRPANDPWFQNSAQNIDFTMPQNGVEMGSEEMNVRVMALSYGGYPAEVIVNAYQTSTRNARAPVVLTTPTTQNGIYGQTLIDKVDALLAQSIMAGRGDFDRIWDAGMVDIMASGGKAVMDERIAIANSVWP